jgi:hypothetical protein
MSKINDERDIVYDITGDFNISTHMLYCSSNFFIIEDVFAHQANQLAFTRFKISFS